MGVFATSTDVADRFGSELSPDQVKLVDARIADAEALLMTEVPALSAGTSGLPAITLANAKRVVCDAVLRPLRNPAGLLSERSGPFEVQFRASAMGEEVYFTPDQLALFRRKRRVGVIGVSGPSWLAV
ncbi:hypothetical protein ACFRAQ_35080 [Nocardia sp. NPDC056611]|uniref:hypothetical protein n=1 Tax=Nocardia sp. NPDC056611 TaxID=3345877 RepID=UPI00366E1075